MTDTDRQTGRHTYTHTCRQAGTVTYGSETNVKEGKEGTQKMRRDKRQGRGGWTITETERNAGRRGKEG